MQYSKDGPFSDPVVRCDSCQRLLMVEKLKAMGACICGSRKVRNIAGYNDKELEAMKKWNIDPDFIALFEPIDETGVCDA